jgi:hypothetical protein
LKWQNQIKNPKADRGMNRTNANSSPPGNGRPWESELKEYAAAAKSPASLVKDQLARRYGGRLKKPTWFPLDLNRSSGFFLLTSKNPLNHQSYRHPATKKS